MLNVTVIKNSETDRGEYSIQFYEKNKNLFNNANFYINRYGKIYSIVDNFKLMKLDDFIEYNTFSNNNIILLLQKSNYTSESTIQQNNILQKLVNALHDAKIDFELKTI